MMAKKVWEIIEEGYEQLKADKEATEQELAEALRKLEEARRKLEEKE